jgi:hypothetical protein
MPAATLKSSGRPLDIDIEGEHFFVLHPVAGRYDIAMRAMFGLVPVSGPYALTDPRFEIHDEQQTPQAGP